MIPRLLVSRLGLGLQPGGAAVDVGGRRLARRGGMVGQQLRAAMHAIARPATDHAHCASVQFPPSAAQQGFVCDVKYQGVAERVLHVRDDTRALDEAGRL